jgi:NAD(P)-dependent dehydrogenase (short-subunit alcohol dehydrogenase family)
MNQITSGCKRYMDKVCLITGGTKGIGMATAQRLLAEQAKAVFICSSQQTNVNQALKSFGTDEKRIHGYQCDVTQKQQRVELLKRIEEMYGRLDVLILNQAVISHIGKQMEITEANFDEAINVNLKSIFFMIQEALPLLRKSKKSNVLLTSSMSAVDPFYQIGVYGMTKAGVNNLAKSLSVELMEDNIRVNAIAPGLVNTDMSAPFIRGNSVVNEKNCAKPEDIASVIATICSDDGTFMNGEVYTVHGGFPRL